MKIVWGIIAAALVLLVGTYSYGVSYAYESEMYHFCKDTLKKSLKDSASLIIDEAIVAPSGSAQEYLPERKLKSGHFKSTITSVAIKYSAKNSYGAYVKDFAICEFSADIEKSDGKYIMVTPETIYVGDKKITNSTNNADDILLWHSSTGGVGSPLKITPLSALLAAYDMLVDKADFIKPKIVMK